MSFDLNRIAKLRILEDLASRIRSRIDTFEGLQLKRVDIEDNTLQFFTSTDTSAEPAFICIMQEAYTPALQ